MTALMVDITGIPMFVITIHAHGKLLFRMNFSTTFRFSESAHFKLGISLGNILADLIITRCADEGPTIRR
jgi:hypothetical protein